MIHAAKAFFLTHGNVKGDTKFSSFANCMKSPNMCTVLSISRPSTAVCVKWMIEAALF